MALAEGLEHPLERLAARRAALELGGDRLVRRGRAVCGHGSGEGDGRWLHRHRAR